MLLPRIPPLLYILGPLLLAGCDPTVVRTTPTPRVVETGELVGATDAVRLSATDVTSNVDKVDDASRDVGRALDRVDEANRRVSSKTAELQRQMLRVRALSEAEGELKVALDNQERLAVELGDDNARLGLALKKAQAAKVLQDTAITRLRKSNAAKDEDIAILQGAVTTVVKTSLKSAEEGRAQSQALDEALVIVGTLQPTKDKLSWWRWFGVIQSACIAVYILLRLFGAAVWTWIRIQAGGFVRR